MYIYLIIMKQSPGMRKLWRETWHHNYIRICRGI